MSAQLVADVIYELFENITNGYDEAKIFREKLINNEGLREEDINTVLFKGKSKIRTIKYD